MRIKPLLPPALVVLVVAALAAYAASTAIRVEPAVHEDPKLSTIGNVVGEVDAELARLWTEQGLTPAPPLQT